MLVAFVRFSRGEFVMGLWNFAKSVGAKIFGASEAKAAPAE